MLAFSDFGTDYGVQEIVRQRQTVYFAMTNSLQDCFFALT
jgi:hypothetical protein